MFTFSLKNLFEWIQMGWYASYPLIFCSLTIWAIIFERFIHYRAIQKNLQSFNLVLQNALLKGEVENIKQICKDQIYIPTARITLDGMEKLFAKEKKIRQYWKESMERTRLIENQNLKKNLWILGTIATTAPFIGLFGTVIGILRSFFSIAEAGKGGFAIVAAGIAEALVATAGGIIVAVIASFAFNSFQNYWSSLVFKMRISTEELKELMDNLSEDSH